MKWNFQELWKDSWTFGLDLARILRTKAITSWRDITHPSDQTIRKGFDHKKFDESYKEEENRIYREEEEP